MSQIINDNEKIYFTKFFSIPIRARLIKNKMYLSIDKNSAVLNSEILVAMINIFIITY